jgi:NitT/TauT family transport system ATP-binding protein
MTVAATASRILLNNVSISYATPRGRLLVVDRVSLAVDRAEFVVLVGPSGSGKSTILRAIAGLNAAESGIISVDGKTVEGPPEHIGFMFQRDTLLPWLTVRGNIEIGLELAGVASAERSARVADLLALLRLSEFHDATLRRHAASRFVGEDARLPTISDADGRAVRRARLSDQGGDGT